MAQEVLNNANNIQIAHGISAWFQQDFTGNYQELGDLVVDGVNIAPEFAEHQSSRNGVRAVRKRILIQKAGSMTLTLYEPTILNLRRILYGGAIETNQSKTLFEGRLMKVYDGGTAGADYIDFADVQESINYAKITVTAIYLTDDVEMNTNVMVTATETVPDTYGHVVLGTIGTVDPGEYIYVAYSIAETGMKSVTLFGSSSATVEGALQLQVRNPNGGIMQIWDLASVQLAPNGDISYPLDAIQALPLLATLQERSGTFGKIYTK